jgi:hypothetical protein
MLLHRSIVTRHLEVASLRGGCRFLGHMAKLIGCVLATIETLRVARNIQQVIGNIVTLRAWCAPGREILRGRYSPWSVVDTPPLGKQQYAIENVIYPRTVVKTKDRS